MPTRYYTYRRNAALAARPGQTVKFLRGHGYYVAGRPKRSSTAPKAKLTVRQKVVLFCHWGVAHTAAIHYAEVRPIPTVKAGALPGLPFTTDCSGFATMAYQYAGARNPNRKDGSWKIRGTEFTGTLLEVGKRVPLAKVQPGDIAVFGCKSYPAGHHATVVTAVHARTYAGVELASHGSENGPLPISVADEARYQPDGLRGVVFLSFLP